MDTLLLCESNIKTLVENDLDIPVKQATDRMIFNGMVCVDQVKTEAVPPVEYQSKTKL